MNGHEGIGAVEWVDVEADEVEAGAVSQVPQAVLVGRPVEPVVQPVCIGERGAFGGPGAAAEDERAPAGAARAGEGDGRTGREDMKGAER